MNDDAPGIRCDTTHYHRHLMAFYAGLTPVIVALLYTVFHVQSFGWFVTIVAAGFLATLAITMCILPYPKCASCGRTVRQRPLDIHTETGSPSYYCHACDIRWIVEEPRKLRSAPASSGGFTEKR